MPNTIPDQRNVLLVDSDEAFGHVLQPLLGSNYLLQQEPTIAAAIAAFEAGNFDAVLLNLQTVKPAEKAHLLLRTANERAVPIPVIVYSCEPRSQSVLDAFKEGAFDVLSQPLDVQQLRFALDRACRRVDLSRELTEARRLLGANRVEGLLGNSKAIERVSDVTRKVAEVFTTVLITGESGTGKGVVAQAIHRMSARAGKPFVSFSVCSFPDSLIEEELFGHEKGAFTGAIQTRRGRFEEANGGTIFIDEIGDLALPLQAKLLRALQERTVERLGSNVSRPIDVRVICATNRNLEKMVEEGTFREDLYFRISVVKIQMPTLRERKDDIPLLAEHFLRMFAKTHSKAARTLTPGFLSALTRHPWPGNVRELQNVIERSVVLANGNEHLGVGDLPEELKELTISAESVCLGSFHEAVQGFKKELVRSALRMHGGNRLKAANELGISRCYLHRLLNQFNLADDEAPTLEIEEDDEPVLRTFKEAQAEPHRLTARIA
ncbi:MAG TPA: sigma-54 dependent transcriptional regulator [Candidatus Sulfotelmatobacter sp.]|nr:sigma-54 dependent transcriptional regulator [Candidatus Sulfotelmatobacter sp.]